MTAALQVHSAAIGVVTEMVYGCRDVDAVYGLAEPLPDEAGPKLYELIQLYADFNREHGLVEFRNVAMGLAVAQAWADNGP